MCKEEDMSYGVILFTIKDNKLLYLISKRRYSYAYIEFLLYRRIKDRIEDLINNMTRREIYQILNYKLERLWSDIYLEPFKYSSFKNSWKRSSFRRLIIEAFRNSKKKYEGKLRFALTKRSGNENKKVLYEFPKGRPNEGESGLDCALREFKEETGIDPKDFIKIDDSFTDNYIGEDGEKYVSILYPMFVPYNKIDPIMDSHSDCIIFGKCVSPEVEFVRWMNKEECERVLSSDKMMFVQYIEKNMGKV
jgi:8-oxo-dGTP pyrophosphatase MutT (NUDIX family)